MAMLLPEGTRDHKTTPIAVGVICHGFTFPACEAAYLKELLATTGVKVVAVIEIKYPEGTPSARRNAWDLFARRFVYPHMAALEPVSMKKAFAEAKHCVCNLEPSGKHGVQFSKNDLSLLGELRLDVLLNAQYKILRGGILSLPRYGVWSFHHGDERCYRGGPAGFWEIYNGERTSGAILQRLTEKLDGGIILRRGTFVTNKSSLARQRDNVFFESAHFVRSAISQIIIDPEWIVSLAPSPTKAKVYLDPSLLQITWFCIGILLNKLREQIRRLFTYEAWGIAVADQPIHKFLDCPNPIRRWFPEQAYPFFIADPFAWEQREKGPILFEYYDYLKERGAIATFDAFGKVCPVLQLPLHLSYPFVLNESGGTICIPECLQSKSAKVYQWRPGSGMSTDGRALLENLPIVDPTVCFFGGWYWLLFTLSGAHTDACSQLYAYYAKSFDGEFRPHALNPIKCDVRSSRPAGTPFVHNGTLYRPSQDCSETYGGATVINRVAMLTPTDFHEEQVSRIEPDCTYSEGTHHLAAYGNATLLDGKRTVWSLRPLWHRLRTGSHRRLEARTLETFEKGCLDLSDPSHFRRFVQHQGMDGDGWCGKKVRLFFRASSREGQLSLRLLFPGIQNEARNTVCVTVNGKSISKRTIKPGVMTVVVPKLRTGEINEIGITSRQTFRLSPPDLRSRALRLESIELS